MKQLTIKNLNELELAGKLKVIEMTLKRHDGFESGALMLWESFNVMEAVPLYLRERVSLAWKKVRRQMKEAPMHRRERATASVRTKSCLKQQEGPRRCRLQVSWDITAQSRKEWIDLPILRSEKVGPPRPAHDELGNPILYCSNDPSSPRYFLPRLNHLPREILPDELENN